jgi:hypothetical protein
LQRRFVAAIDDAVWLRDGQIVKVKRQGDAERAA